MFWSSLASNLKYITVSLSQNVGIHTNYGSREFRKSGKQRKKLKNICVVFDFYFVFFFFCYFFFFDVKEIATALWSFLSKLTCTFFFLRRRKIHMNTRAHPFLHSLLLLLAKIDDKLRAIYQNKGIYAAEK